MRLHSNLGHEPAFQMIMHCVALEAWKHEAVKLCHYVPSKVTNFLNNIKVLLKMTNTVPLNLKIMNEPNFNKSISDNCPKFNIHDIKNDETDSRGLRMRANFTMEKSKVSTGELISQSVDLEFSQDGKVQIAKCDNCAWDQSMQKLTQLEGRNIGPLMRDIIYVPIIKIKSRFRISNKEDYEEFGTSTQQCRGIPFITSEWVCDDGVQRIGKTMFSLNLATFDTHYLLL